MITPPVRQRNLLYPVIALPYSRVVDGKGAVTVEHPQTRARAQETLEGHEPLPVTDWVRRVLYRPPQQFASAFLDTGRILKFVIDALETDRPAAAAG